VLLKKARDFPGQPPGVKAGGCGLMIELCVVLLMRRTLIVRGFPTSCGFALKTFMILLIQTLESGLREEEEQRRRAGD
jgi:hypothetical protein